jgi:hypothetical protein
MIHNRRSHEQQDGDLQHFAEVPRCALVSQRAFQNKRRT